VWNEVIDTQVYVAEISKAMLHDWKDARRIINTSCAQSRQEGNAKWLKRVRGRFKCNILMLLSPNFLVEWEYEFV